ncbi:hypothetical protein AB0I22_24810 [Streptomyces sp. NPDC050610]|uniref:hypothetical protein n=1 Tax=Streptomyces sp. NPDC050610 TaxID=3157097 RepID=UPI003416303A
MTAAARLMPFPEERVLEDAAFVQGMAPKRLYALLLPVWEVEVRADITEGEDFALIDRFVGRGLRRGGLRTIDELEAFFSLDRALIVQAVRFLIAIGHIVEHDGRLALTDLGARSVDDDVLYVMSRQDRRKLYFEALTCTPMLRAYYDEDTVSLLSGDRLQQVLRGGGYPQFRQVAVEAGFDRSALELLNRRKDRARFNLPVAFDALESLGEVLTFLPVYLVRGAEDLLVYSQAGGGSAPDAALTDLCSHAAWLTGPLDNEDQREVLDERSHGAAMKWLGEQQLNSVAPEQDEDGTWLVPLPPDRFGEGGLPFTRIGSYRMAGTHFFRLWCADATKRKYALLERLDQRLGARSQVTRAEVEQLAALLARQLRLDLPSLVRLRVGAGKAGLHGLESRLGRLEDEKA